MKPPLRAIHQKLYAYFGPQNWWPGDSAFEVMVGAILTQNTNWANVEKAIRNLKRNKVFTARKLNRLPPAKLAALIRPAGYYNIKAKRLKNFLIFFLKHYRGSAGIMSAESAACLRQELLSVNGIGPETADSILLYALNKPVFVVDAYTKRIFSRHKLIQDNASYAQLQDLFMHNLKPGAKLFNEYHALLVKLGKEFCLKNKPKCNICPLK
jgi:endonuclease-3 related protein